MIFIDGSNFYHGLKEVIGTARIDFAVAVEAVKKLNKPVECAFFKAKKCFHIQKVASRFIPLDKNYLLSCILPGEKHKIK